MPEPVLPPGRSDATGDGSPTDWVRTHAALSANTISGPPGMYLPPGVGAGIPGCVSPHGAGASATTEVWSVGAWALLMRGVAGFLAVLSVARI